MQFICNITYNIYVKQVWISINLFSHLSPFSICLFCSCLAGCWVKAVGVEQYGGLCCEQTDVVLPAEARLGLELLQIHPHSFSHPRADLGRVPDAPKGLHRAATCSSTHGPDTHTHCCTLLSPTRHSLRCHFTHCALVSKTMKKAFVVQS